MSKQQLLNILIDNITMDETVSAVDNFIKCDKKAYIVPTNVDMMVKAEKDDYLREIINNADLTVADGKPLIWISKLQKNELLEKVSGSDLSIELLKLANDKKYSIFIIGGKKGVAEKAKTNIYTKYPDIRDIYTYSPDIGFEKNANELIHINDLISEANPDILFACFGCPKQEEWVYENYKKYNAKVTLCAGATVDFLAGTVKRAPKWMSDVGLEWFYRFLQEPRRLFKRYFIDDLKIVKLIFKYQNK